MHEEWKDIDGYESWYQVSNLGRVKRLKKVHCNHGKRNIVYREHILKPSSDRKGYLYVSITNGDTKATLKVHRLVAQAFISNPDNKPQVDHINRIVTDNRVENLRWCSNSENQMNSSRNVIINCFGKSMPMKEWSKITGIKNHTIRARLKRGWKPEEALTIKPLGDGQRLNRR